MQQQVDRTGYSFPRFVCGGDRRSWICMAFTPSAFPIRTDVHKAVDTRYRPLLLLSLWPCQHVKLTRYQLHTATQRWVAYGEVVGSRHVAIRAVEASRHPLWLLWPQSMYIGWLLLGQPRFCLVCIASECISLICQWAFMLQAMEFCMVSHFNCRVCCGRTGENSCLAASRC